MERAGKKSGDVELLACLRPAGEPWTTEALLSYQKDDYEVSARVESLLYTARWASLKNPAEFI